MQCTYGGVRTITAVREFCLVPPTSLFTAEAPCSIYSSTRDTATWNGMKILRRGDSAEVKNGSVVAVPH